MAWKKLNGVLCAVAVSLLWTNVTSAVDVFHMPVGLKSLEVVPVGNPGNAPDTRVMNDFLHSTGYGQVNYDYSIGKYDVTAAQYTMFLNAVAATDTQSLYTPSMAGSKGCGISRSGNPGSYTYTTTKNGNFPVNYVNFWDTCRFANWIQNGQPTGPEGPGTTETGAYTLTADGMGNNTITRNTGTTWAVASENEWYKSAYYNPATSSYYLYATSSNAIPCNKLSATGTNNANYFDSYYMIGTGGYTDPTNYLSEVGAFSASPSPYGTFDQSGNVSQWNDSNILGVYRGIRGGSFESVEDESLKASGRGYDVPVGTGAGFRVVEVPEPALLGLLTLGGVGLLARRRRVRVRG